MISDNDLASAVSAGIISQETADALRGHSNSLRATPQADEENFRLVSSFNDIFVALAGGLFLFGIAWFGKGLAPLLLAPAAWGLSEFFTLKRRMALPSIVFFLVFEMSILWAMFSLLNIGGGFFGVLYDNNEGLPLTRVFLSYGIAFVASYAHWWRFKVPIAISACAGCVVFAVLAIILSIVGDVGQWTLILLLVLGLTVFAYALYWDRQDRNRTTRKSDVAFWLHLLAAPMIVHPIFALMGINWLDSDVGESSAAMLAVLAVAVYIILGIVAVIIDRRALLVSALAYVITALIYLISQTELTSSNLALAIILIGSALLLLSAFWQNLRGWMIPKLPQSWTQHLPPAKIEAR